MILFIALAAADAVADLFAARYLYGRMRAHAIDSSPLDRHTALRHAHEDRVFRMTGAFMLAFIWPLALLGLGLYHFMLTTPVRSQYELEAEADALERRIRELEKELKL